MTRKTYPWTTWRMELRQLTLNAHIWWVKIRAYNFFVCGQKFENFFVQRGWGCWSATFSVFDMSIPPGDNRDQSRKFSEIAPNFGLFALPNFKGRTFQKLYPRYHPCLSARRLEKFREDTPTIAEVIGAHLLNFKPNFKSSRPTFFLGGGPVSVLVCAGKPRSISSLCKKNWGVAYPKGQNVAKVRRTFFLERGTNRSRSHVFSILDILTLSGDIRDHSLKLYKIPRKNFACF